MALPGRREILIVAALGALFLGASALGAEPADGATLHAAGSVTDGGDDARLDPEALEDLVGPVALYPDDLLALVLEAAKNPLQVVQAARYLRALEQDPSLEPDPDWDPAVVALLNYPEALAKLDADLEWTQALGRATVQQERALLDAVDRFRRQSRSAGNLVSDERQRVEADRHAVRIRPADPTVLYVPRYEPRLARIRHRSPIVGYYPRPCPVYYYPYPAGHFLTTRHFWGLHSVFRIGWEDRDLRFLMLEHRSHPYHGAVYRLRDHRYWEPRLRYRDHWGERRWRGDRFGVHDRYDRYDRFRRLDGVHARLDGARRMRLSEGARERRSVTEQVRERAAARQDAAARQEAAVRERVRERVMAREAAAARARSDRAAAAGRSHANRAVIRAGRGAADRPGRARVDPQ